MSNSSHAEELIRQLDAALQASSADTIQEAENGVPSHVCTRIVTIHGSISQFCKAVRSIMQQGNVRFPKGFDVDDDVEQSSGDFQLLAEAQIARNETRTSFIVCMRRVSKTNANYTISVIAPPEISDGNS